MDSTNTDAIVVPVKREVPLVWILSGLAIVGAQAVSMYFSVQRLGELVATVVVEVGDLKKQTAVAEKERDRAQYVQDSLLRRVQDVETRVRALEQPERPTASRR